METLFQVRRCRTLEGGAMGDMRNMDHLLEEMDTELPDEELLYDLADLFKVFSDTTRIKILYALMGKELRVGEIAEVIGATQSAVSHQLRTLKQAHLVKFSRDGKNVLYSLADDHVITMLAQGLTHVCE
jgi:DNA-binding transcriptional ArsR family regulator